MREEFSWSRQSQSEHKEMKTAQKKTPKTFLTSGTNDWTLRQPLLLGIFGRETEARTVLGGWATQVELRGNLQNAT